LSLTPGGNSGITTVTDVSVPMIQQFMVDSFFDVFAELSLDGGPFIPQPERHITLASPVPEPGSAGLALISMSGIAAAAWMRRRRTADRRS
jgi:hypothetical protein